MTATPTRPGFSQVVAPPRAVDVSKRWQARCGTAYDDLAMRRALDAQLPTLQSHGRGDVDSCDVLIAGAGPTGLTLAAELARFGISVLLVDSSLDRAHESRALAVQPRSLEILHRLGVARS